MFGFKAIASGGSAARGRETPVSQRSVMGVGQEGSIGRADFVSQHGIFDPPQRQAAADILRRAQDDNVRTVRISFADQHGILRGKTLVAGMLESVLRTGCSITSTLLLKDTAHRTVYPIWQGAADRNPAQMSGASDMILVPDPTTFRLLPWAPGSAWMLADCYHQNGASVPYCTRSLCRRVLMRLSDSGYRFLAGLEIEFYIFRLIDPKLEPQQCGQPSEAPTVRMLSHGYQYLTENRYDELEPILEQIRAALAALELPVRSLESEMGPGQCELTFGPTEGLQGADNVILIRSAIKQICRRNGYHATFMCRPALPNIASSGWHLHQSLLDARTGQNAFVSSDERELLSACGRHYVAGLLENARAACLLAAPTINGYKRYRPYSMAPSRIVWARDNRGAMIRVIGAPGDPGTHLENRIGESAANPYLYFVSQIIAGQDGMTRRLQPPAAADAPYESSARMLPASIVDAMGELRQSALFRAELGAEFVDYLLTIKEHEVHRFLSEEVTDWEQREYFELF
jgi:glutamine synthetase